MLATILFRVSCLPVSSLQTYRLRYTELSFYHACETWSPIPPTLREEHRIKLSENRVLRRIFGPEREEVMGGWRTLHNEELHNLCISPNIIRVIE